MFASAYQGIEDYDNAYLLAVDTLGWRLFMTGLYQIIGSIYIIEPA